MFFRCIYCLAAFFTIVMLSHAQVNGLGETEFANSGAPEAQEAFLRGLLLLHSFEYEDSREAFSEARKIDKDFAMAYWGEAMAYNHPVWFLQGTEDAKAVLEKLGATLEERLEKAPTEREKDYLRGVDILYYSDDDKERRDFNYMAYMERMAEKYPGDLDAKAFYALSLLGCSHGGRDFALYMRAAAAAEDVFARNPKHPGAAHYLIHSYDDPVHAPLGLRAAHTYAEIAPSAAHALHMPSHVFTALGMWDRVVRSNIDAYQASEQRRIRKGLPLTARSYHALHWKMYGLLQQGRSDEAREAVYSAHADLEASDGAYKVNANLAMIRSTYLTDTGHWNSDVADIEVDGERMEDETRANHLFVEGMIALKAYDQDGAYHHVKKLMDMDVGGKAREVATILQHELKSLLLMKEGNTEEAVKLLRKATELEEAMPFDFGPPSPVKPSYELLGEILLELGEYEEAQEAFAKALARTPKRARSLHGLATAAAKGKDEEAAENAHRMLKEISHKAHKDYGGKSKY